jgi:hypothetical protein
MATAHETELRLRGMGMTSAVLGTIGLMLFFLPILGLPISVCGLAAGFLGLIGALATHGRLRWSVVGIAMSIMALGINVAILYAPSY